jgi:DNA (cytosine-5)-methyltransferase 1
VIDHGRVRKLTPVEWERLQGYPDGWTATSDGRPQADSARYRQLGNSVAIPVFTWVALGIAEYEAGR